VNKIKIGELFFGKKHGKLSHGGNLSLKFSLQITPIKESYVGLRTH
jgi:hypothetical protein